MIKSLYTSLMTFMALAVLTLSCNKEDSMPAPTADFSFTVANLAVTFKNESTNGRYFSWDFGDGSDPSTQMAPGYSYEEEGTYTVTLTVTGRDGSTTEISKDVTVVAPPNLVQGGKFEPGDEAMWTVSTISSGVTINFTNGTAVYSGGGWGHAAIYQPIEVEANKKYQVNMKVSGTGATDTWFEVYVGSAEPELNKDYSDGGKRLALNTWAGCGKTEFSGPLTALDCDGTGGGVVEFPVSGTVYLLIKSGGANLGTGGIVVDNVEMRPIQ